MFVATLLKTVQQFLAFPRTFGTTPRQIIASAANAFAAPGHRVLVARICIQCAAPMPNGSQRRQTYSPEHDG
ncbi:hypothetical protein Tasa_002_025 [Tanticharoenia sakaeratensis NBRC 103193]|uniref:Uncharacterized protein n=1 Tax=Tanticharoenia sakaeratensis NBRC 103193 TaxID=1231623 RepID=A0A0D6MH19_9PROT|nr:hypothetical protein [Tanticharoenia sakaeratensis]GAN52745.1 hypothetical protein Tasa_002_025 [Tanticharoenia sakaeratensis NBRC 103193]GBQ17894.1 hypothetical protein AA103193_0510 [Tanticharoenia sakaeratensis NBRC 103193]